MDRDEMEELERRIDERARHLWEEAGRPEGREHEYRQRARQLIAIEDNPHGASEPVPVGPEKDEARGRAEPLEAVENQGEFPTLTDQGEEETAPHRRGED